MVIARALWGPVTFEMQSVSAECGKREMKNQQIVRRDVAVTLIGISTMASLSLVIITRWPERVKRALAWASSDSISFRSVGSPAQIAASVLSDKYVE
jgi:hypothetical protein